MNSDTNQTEKKELKKRRIAVGVFTVVAVLGLGFGIGLATGVVHVPMAHACCGAPPTSPPPPSTPPPPPPPPSTPPPSVPTTPTPPPAPKCEFLKASDNSLTAPGTVTLSWKTDDASSESIDNGVGSVSGSTGSKTVSVTKTTTYKLSISNSSGSADCATTVTITVPAPTCTLSASQTTIAPGGSSTLTWSTTNAASASLSGSGSVSTSGTKSVSPTSDTTYTLTVKGNDGSTITCPAPIKVTAPQPDTPACTLDIDHTTIQKGGSATISWTSTNAASVSLQDQATGSYFPGVYAKGSATITPDTSRSYLFTAQSASGKTVTCTKSITVTTTNPAPVCTLAISKSSIAPGDTATLSWTTQNATSASINNSIGSVTPVAAGNTDVKPSASTTYLLTATGPGGTVTCSAPVTVTDHPAPACTLTADDTSLSKGDSTKLNWTTSNADTITIDQGIGSVTPVPGGSATVSPSSDTTYTATATGPYGTKTCSVTITVSTPGCTSNCGGGGGGGHHGGSSPKPVVTLVGTSTQGLSYVYLSQIPYTGLDLGTFGTIVYWLGLILWSLALAYLVLFKLFPYTVRRISAFGMEVGRAVNGPVHDAHADHGVPVQSAHAAHSVPAPVPHVDPIVMPHTDPIISDAPRATGYSTYDGFRSFAPATEPLSIDDIVKGLSREPYRAPAPAPMPVHEAAHAAEAPREERAPAPAPKPAAAPRTVDVDPEVPAFLNALLSGDRDRAFGMLRDTVKSGANAEDFLAQIACALDDAYRARTEGAPVNGEVKRMTDGIATPVLERLVTSLTTAVDSTYSVGITGAKLAVARALATLGA